MYRQGDVLIVAANDAGGEEVHRDQGRIVLAYGEVTGHAHAIRSRGAVLKQAKDMVRSLIVTAKKGVQLRHEEHSTIHIPMGTYRVIQQREYTPQGLRNVVD